MAATTSAQTDRLSLTTKITDQKYCGGIYTDMAMLRQISATSLNSKNINFNSDLISDIVVRACTSVAWPYPIASRDFRIGAGRSSDVNGTGTAGKADRSWPSRRTGGGGGGSRGEPRGRIATTRIWRSFPDFFEGWSIRCRAPLR